MITIEMGNITSRINGIIGDANYILADALSYKLTGFAITKEQQFLYNPKTGATYTGLIPHALTVFDNLGLEYKIIDRRSKPKSDGNYKIVKGFEARDYQETIINRASSREIIQAATGAGKTFIIAALIARFNVKFVVVVAPKISLAEQLKEELEKFFGIEIGIIGGGKHIVKGITVGTPQSLLKDPVLKNAEAIFIDETHNLPSATIFNVACAARNAYYRIGVSATPWRDAGDDILIEAALNIRKPNLSINASKLIAKGKLVPCTINFISMDSGVDWLGNYSDTYNQAIVNNLRRNTKIVSLTKKSLLTRNAVLILISKIEHGNKLWQMIKDNMEYEERIYRENGKSYNIGTVEFISGIADTDRRRAVFQAVKDGFCKVMIGSTIADEGLDIPILDCLILAGSGKSSTRAFQRIGRVLRLHALKKDAIVYDFWDSNTTFNRHSQIRCALYKTEPLWEIEPLTC